MAAVLTTLQTVGLVAPAVGWLISIEKRLFGGRRRAAGPSTLPQDDSLRSPEERQEQIDKVRAAYWLKRHPSPSVPSHVPKVPDLEKERRGVRTVYHRFGMDLAIVSGLLKLVIPDPLTKISSILDNRRSSLVIIGLSILGPMYLHDTGDFTGLGVSISLILFLLFLVRTSILRISSSFLFFLECVILAPIARDVMIGLRGRDDSYCWNSELSKMQDHWYEALKNHWMSFIVSNPDVMCGMQEILKCSGFDVDCSTFAIFDDAEMCPVKNCTAGINIAEVPVPCAISLAVIAILVTPIIAFIYRFFLMAVDPKKDPIDEFREVFNFIGNGLEVPKYTIKHWKEDKFFAWQRLNGCNPTLIRRVVDKLPSDCVVDDDDVVPVAGVTLETLIKQKKLYLCDYEQLEDIGAPADRCLMAPLVLLYVDSSFKLMPLAIQLTRYDPVDGQRVAQKIETTTGNELPAVFTPKDEQENLWLSAKTHVQVADSVLHEVSAHLWATHFAMEATYVAMVRNLHVSHPIHVWLFEHFMYTIDINVLARSSLISNGGLVPTMMACGFEGQNNLLSKAATNWRWHQYDIPYSIKHRGLDNPGELPGNSWAKDAESLWTIINNFCEKMVNIFYKDDAAVRQDTELQAWMEVMTREVAHDGCGFKGIYAALHHNDPAAMNDVDQKKFNDDHQNANKILSDRTKLSKFLTMIVYCVSAGHAAVNNQQYSIMAYIPNSPATFRMPYTKLAAVKRGKEKIDWKTFLKALPSSTSLIVQHIGLVNVLSTPADADQSLGDFPEPGTRYFFPSPETREKISILGRLRTFFIQITGRSTKSRLGKRQQITAAPLPTGVKSTRHCIASAINRLKEALHQMDDDVGRRNEASPGSEYLWLKPDQIASSIAV